MVYKFKYACFACKLKHKMDAMTDHLAFAPTHVEGSLYPQQSFKLVHVSGRGGCVRCAANVAETFNIAASFRSFALLQADASNYISSLPAAKSC